MSEREETYERTNEDWLADLQAGDPVRSDALEALRERLRRGVYFYLSRDRSDLSDRSPDDLMQMADDFAQDALLRVLDNLDTFRGESRFTTWAAKIAVRVALTELRRARWKDFSLETLTDEGDYMPRVMATAVKAAGEANPEQAAERENVMTLIGQAIDAVLTERQRTALVAVSLEGVPLEEVARRMDTNRNALYKLLHDARVKLRQHMERQGLSMDYVMDLFQEK